MAADPEGGEVVFLIGMHVNRVHRRGDARHVAATFAAMAGMLRDLSRHPELGMLHASAGWFHRGPGVVQYWRSYEHLEQYARSPDAAHLPAWRRFAAASRTSDAVGIYHETYRITPGDVETLYHHVPPTGLLAATGSRPLSRGSTSAQRMRAPR